MIQPLSNNDKKVLQSKITIVKQVYTMVMMCLSIVILGGVISFKKIPVLSENFILSSVLFIVFSLAIFCFFLWRSLKQPTAELRAGKKKVRKGVVTNKERFVKYGTSNSFLVNLVLTPKLVDYYIFMDEVKLYVQKEDYVKFEIGDKIQSSSSITDNKLISLEKVDSI